MTSAAAAVPGWIGETLARCGLPAATGGAPLTGGVSSDVWRVDLPGQVVCVKRARPQLAVAGDWRAPIERSHWEARWLQLADALVPGAACPIVAADDEGHALVLGWLAPEDHPVWKEQLLAGTIEPATAALVGERLAALHAALRPYRDELDESKPLFDTLRRHPYLRVTAEHHPVVADRLLALDAELADARQTVIHGDVSPKNVLAGPDGPVLLDAECASTGDPAFDVAFCVNHLLLKAVWRTEAADAYLGSAGVLLDAYLDGVDWEPATDVDRRTAQLLPGLALARVDGLSPVEYLTEERGRPAVRRGALALLVDPPADCATLLARWHDTAVNAPS
ncbi:MAG: aminoglycoside phosphotransferase family protein [Ilumatobacteraceae bacterium]